MHPCPRTVSRRHRTRNLGQQPIRSRQRTEPRNPDRISPHRPHAARNRRSQATKSVSIVTVRPRWCWHDDLVPMSIIAYQLPRTAQPSGPGSNRPFRSPNARSPPFWSATETERLSVPNPVATGMSNALPSLRSRPICSLKNDDHSYTKSQPCGIIKSSSNGSFCALSWCY